jgi:hypothetical protein
MTDPPTIRRQCQHIKPLRYLIAWTLLAFYLLPAHATSIVAWVLPDRVLLAADSRESFLIRVNR